MLLRHTSLPFMLSSVSKHCWKQLRHVCHACAAKGHTHKWQCLWMLTRKLWWNIGSVWISNIGSLCLWVPSLDSLPIHVFPKALAMAQTRTGVGFASSCHNFQSQTRMNTPTILPCLTTSGWIWSLVILKLCPYFAWVVKPTITACRKSQLTMSY